MSNAHSNAVHIAWTTFQRRQVSMAEDAGFECVFLPVHAGGNVGKIWAYLKNLVHTFSALRKAAPSVVWVQLPQVPVLWAALLYRRFVRRDAKIVADCHNAMFRPPWSRFPLGLSLFRYCDCVVVHNDMVEAQALALGVPAQRVMVLEDVPPLVDHAMLVPEPECLAGFPRPWVLFPGSFAADEPIDEVLGAARLAPEITFVITGRTHKAKQNGHDIAASPPNVLMPGFLALDEFDRLLRHADVVIGLTKIEGIQLSVCNEALGYGRPLVVSNTALLSALFAESARVVDSRSPADIVAGVREVLGDPAHFETRSRQHATRRRDAWVRHQLQPLRQRLA